MRTRTLAWMACLTALAAAPAATGRSNTLKLSLTPDTGKYGTVFTAHVTGVVAGKNEQLAMSMTATPGKCPASYAKGFASLSGLADAKGRATGPIAVPVGKLKKNLHYKITISEPGTYGICSYLQYGSVTKAHASAPFTITQ
jgi:hypothetical protein